MIWQGIDTAARITAAQARILRSEGISFVGRYLVPESYGKALTADEADRLRAAGLAVLLCWETTAQRARAGFTAGTVDGTKAREIALSLGVPEGTVIYYAVDYNPPAGDLPLIAQYIRGAQTALGCYVVGAYGPERLVEFLAAEGTCRHYWQCVAWSNMFLPAASVRQYQWQGGEEAKALAAKVGFAVDLDSCDNMRAAGLWLQEAQYAEDDGGVIYAPEPEPWYAGAMAWAEEAGLICDGRPRDNLTRAELATVLQRYDKLVEEKIKLHLLEDDYSIGTKG